MAFTVGFGIHNVNTDVPQPTILPLDGDMQRMKLVDQTQGPGWLHFGHAVTNVGLPVSSENLPTRASRRGASLMLYPKLDFESMSARALVTERVRDVFEELEPGRHQFFPVDVTIGPANKAYGSYFLFFIGNRLDTLVRDLSGPYNVHGMCKGLTDPDGRLVLDSARIGDSHAWAEMFQSIGGRFFVSDKMADRLQEEAFTGLTTFRHIPETKEL